MTSWDMVDDQVLNGPGYADEPGYANESGYADEPDDAHEPRCADAPIVILDGVVAGMLAETFKVLADPTRVRIISALAERPLCVHELAAALELTHSAVSHQLAMLREMRLVTFEKEGRHVVYQLDDAHIHDLFRQGLEHIRHGG